MSDLALVSRELRTTSRIIAEKFGKRHDNVVRAIQSLECSDELNALNFEDFKNNDLTGENTSHYEITRDGFMFLVMGFTGKRAAGWKEEFISAFYAMETHAVVGVGRSNLDRPASVHAIHD